MEKPIKIILSHQDQCDSQEIDKLISFLEEKGIVVLRDYDDIEGVIDLTDCYVCILDSKSDSNVKLSHEIAAAAMAGIRVFGIYCPNLDCEISIPVKLDEFATAISNWDLEKIADAIIGADIGFSDQNGNETKTKRTTSPPACGK